MNIFNKTLNKTLFFVLFTYILTAISVGFVDYYKQQKVELGKIDAKLESGALAAKYLLGNEFNDKLLSDRPSDQEYRQIVKKLTDYADSLGLEYVYTMAEKGGMVYFMASSETADDIRRGTPSIYMNPYPNTPIAVTQAFKSNNKTFAEYSNEWGSFRSVFIPLQTTSGNKLLLAADVKLKAVDVAVNKSIFEGAMFGALMMFPLAPGFLLYMRYQRQRREEIRRRLYTDTLTKLPNRVKLLNDLDGLLGNALVIINIDNFQEVNDIYGHRIGDKILKELALRLQIFVNILSRQANNIFLLYRLPSDEYAILASNKLEDSELANIMEELLKAVSYKPFEIEDNEINLGVTMGASTLSPEIISLVEDGSGLAVAANMALKLARKESKEFFIYDKNWRLKEEYETHLLWLKKLKQAIENDNIAVVFQPIMDVKNQKISKYESLVRLIEADGSETAPDRFLDVAKRSKLFQQVTRIVVDKAFLAFADKEHELSINLSIENLYDAQTMAYIEAKLIQYDIAKRIVIEILESDRIKSYSFVNQKISRLKNLGCKISIDDFGSGYSNFKHILNLNVDYVKLDGSLIENIVTDKNSAVITSSIVGFLKELDIKSVAEYVSSKEVLDKLAIIGVDYAQGYYIGEPKRL